MFRRKKKRRRNPNSGADGDDDDVAADAMTAMAAETASVSLYPEYCQRSNEEDAFLEIAQDFGDDLIAPQAETAATGEEEERQRLPPPPPGFQVRFDQGTEPPGFGI